MFSLTIFIIIIISITLARVFHLQVTHSDVITGMIKHVTARLQPTPACRLASMNIHIPQKKSVTNFVQFGWLSCNKSN